MGAKTIRLNRWSKKNIFLTYEEAKKYIQKALIPKGIDTFKKYKQNTPNLPKFMPSNPKKFYSDQDRGWISYKDFMGCDPESYYYSKGFLNYEDAKAYIQKELIPKGINTYTKYTKYVYLPPFLPVSAHEVYAKKNRGWISRADYMGCDPRSNFNSNRCFLSYEDAKGYIQKELVPKGIDNYNKYTRYVKLPPFLPVSAHKFYAKRNRGWISRADYMGK